MSDERWFRVLFTKHKTQKAKRYQDGRMKVLPSGADHRQPFRTVALVTVEAEEQSNPDAITATAAAATHTDHSISEPRPQVRRLLRPVASLHHRPAAAPSSPKDALPGDIAPVQQSEDVNPLPAAEPSQHVQQQSLPHRRTGSEILALFRRQTAVVTAAAAAVPQFADTEPDHGTVSDHGEMSRKSDEISIGSESSRDGPSQALLSATTASKRTAFECPRLSGRKEDRDHDPRDKTMRRLNAPAAIVAAAASTVLIGSLNQLRFPSLEQAAELAATPPPNLPDSFPNLATYISVLTAALCREIELSLGEFSTHFHTAIAGVPGVAMTSAAGTSRSCPHGNATVHVVKKPGPNRGRQFLKCPKGCFSWVDENDAATGSKSSLPEMLDSLGKRDEEFLKSQGVHFYLDCELSRGFRREYGPCPISSSSMSLTLPWREASSAYAKDDLWVVFTKSKKQSADGGPYLFSSAFHGPARSGELEIVPIPPSSRPTFGQCISVRALHGPNISTEVSMLANLESLKIEEAPLLSFLLDPKCGETPPRMERQLNEEEELLVQSTIDERQLNPDQARVVRECVRLALDQSPSPPVALVHGVFGSGKSSALVVVFELLERLLNCIDEADPAMGTRILFVGATNVAVDRVLTQLVQEGFTSLIRVGSRKKIARELFPFTLRGLGSDEDDVAELKEMLKVARTKAEADSIREEIRVVSEGQLGRRRELVETVRVVGATCAACAFPVLQGCRFRLCFLDECSQMVEPLSLLALGKFGCERAVLVGDPQQLRPVLLSSLALDSADSSSARTVHSSQGEEERAGEGLSKTLFMRLSRCGIEPIMLRTQYRCHPAISAIASRLFYNGKLLDGVSPEERKPLVPGLPPVVLCHADQGKEVADRFGSFYNDQEARAVCAFVEALVVSFGVPAYQIGVIALYKAQVTKITEMLLSKGGEVAAVPVATVDAMQGSEHDVILLSCSRTERLGFSDSPKRLNVAITRARRHLVIFGSAPLLTSNPSWQSVVGPAIATPGGLQSCSRIISTNELELPIADRGEVIAPAAQDCPEEEE